MTDDEYLAHDASGLAERVRAGDVTPTELLDIAWRRIDALNPTVNAVVHRMDDDARRDALRFGSGAPRDVPFPGVPFLAKDLTTMYAGHPTSGGSRLMAGRAVDRDSEMAVRVRASGVSVTGKTNTPEWGLLPTTEPELWGPCRNPWDTSRTPGGSSGGAGAAVASGMVPMAGGADGGGSIRIPASCCGLFGLKPTRGRTPTGPRRGQLWRGASVEHVLSRSVRDSARMLDATHGADVGAPFEIAPPERPFFEEVDADPGQLRIAWTTKPMVDTPVHADCEAAVADAAALLEELGHELVEDRHSLDGRAFARCFITVVVGELGADLEDVARWIGRPARRSELEPATWALTLLAQALSAEEYASALRGLEVMARDVGAFFERYDLVLTPTLATPPPPLGTLGPSSAERWQLDLLGRFGSGRLIELAGVIDKAAQNALDFVPWLPMYNITGQPAMSVPLFWNDEGLPIGSQLVGRFGDEARLLRLAGQLERARPWFDRLPPLARGVGSAEPRSSGEIR